MPTNDDIFGALVGEPIATITREGVVREPGANGRHDQVQANGIECTADPRAKNLEKARAARGSDGPTPFEKSRLAEDDVTKSAKESPDALFNARDPRYAIDHEKPEHRSIIYLKAQGNTNKEIAEITGYSLVSVSNILRQPWAQIRLISEISNSGRDLVRALLSGHAAKAVERLCDEMENDKARPSERIAAANAILDRSFGKPNQPITHHDGERLEDLSDAEIRLRLAELKANRN